MKKVIFFLLAFCLSSAASATVDCTTLSFVYATDNTLTFNLPTSPNCDKEEFIVRQRIYGSGDPFGPSDHTIYDFSQPLAFVESLEPCTEYEFYVEVYCDGEIEGGCVSSFKPMTTTGCPGVDCSGIKVTNIMDDIVTFVFSGFDDCRDPDFLGLKLQYRPVNTSTWFGNVGSTLFIAASYTRIFRLDPCTEYEYRVRFLCDEEYTDWCTGTFMTSGCSDRDCGGIEVADITESEATLTFNGFEDCRPPSSGLLLFQLEYKPKMSTTWQGFPGTFSWTTGNTFQLTGLEACTEYDFRVQFLCNGEFTGWCIGAFETPGCSDRDCGGIEVTNITESEASFIINGFDDCRSTNAGILAFQLQYRQSNSNTWLGNVSTTTGTPGNSTQIFDLKQCTQYNYRINILCDGEYLGWCTGTFRTAGCVNEEENQEKNPEGSSERSAISSEQIGETDQHFKVYPNPILAGSSLHIMGVNKEDLRAVQIFSVSGQLLYETRSLPNGILDIPARLHQGIYILVISGADFKEQSRLLIQ